MHRKLLVAGRAEKAGLPVFWKKAAAVQRRVLAAAEGTGAGGEPGDGGEAAGKGWPHGGAAEKKAGEAGAGGEGARGAGQPVGGGLRRHAFGERGTGVERRRWEMNGEDRAGKMEMGDEQGKQGEEDGDGR